MILKPKEPEQKFSEWALERYNKAKEQLTIINADGTVDPLRLNGVMVAFTENYTWAITVLEVESNKLSHDQNKFDAWYKARYNEAVRVLRAEDPTRNRAPSAALVDAKIESMVSNQLAAYKKEIVDQSSRVELMRGFVKSLDKLAAMVQTLSANMRSELFYSAGVPARQTLGEKAIRRTADAASVLSNALRSSHKETPTEEDDEVD